MIKHNHNKSKNSKTKAAIAGLMKNDKIIGIFAKNPKTGEIIDELKYDDDRVLTKSELLAFFQRETIEVGPDILIRYNRGGNISTSEPIEAYDKRTLNSQGITSTKVQLGITCRNKFNFRFVFEHPAACSCLSAKYLIFLFCTFLFIIPLCNLSIFTLVPGSVTFALPCRKKETAAQNAVQQSRPENFMRFTHPDNPAAASRGWGGAACAAPLLRSDAPAPGSR